MPKFDKCMPTLGEDSCYDLKVIMNLALAVYNADLRRTTEIDSLVITAPTGVVPYTLFGSA